MSERRAVIFANAELADPGKAQAALRTDDWLIAANGGTRHLQMLGLAPDVVIGDLDSLAPGEPAALQAGSAQLILYPVRKDRTDLELALRCAVEGGAKDILVFGALGVRWDQTLANLLLLALPDLGETRVRLLDGKQQIYLIRNKTTIEGQPGDTVSLIPLRGDAHGITTDGLEYPLDDGTLPFGSTLGISNTLLTRNATVELREGLLICVVIHK